MTAPIDMSRLHHQMMLRFTAGNDLDLAVLAAAGAGKEDHASKILTDIFDWGETVESVSRDITETLGGGPRPDLYLKTVHAGGTDYTFFTVHGQGEDNCGELLWRIALLLSIPDVAAACTAAEVVVS